MENKSDLFEPEPEPLERKTRWLIPQRLDLMSFVGKDVVAVATDMYIQFLNLRTGLELVYVADGPDKGDGVDVIAGYKSNMFVFAEKTRHARIFIMNYPTFNIMGELKDTDVNRYKGLCLMEAELVAAFSGFPNYILTVWNWRTAQRLIMLPTGIIRRQQIFSVSRSHTMVCQCYGQGLIVWEVAPCFRKCFLMRRAKEAVTNWDLPEAALIAAAWSNEGQLFVLDADSKFYSATTDNVKMQTVLEWELEGLKGDYKPLMCALGNGFLMYGPDAAFRWLKLNENNKKWFLKWTYPFEEEDVVLNLISSAGADNAVAWTKAGRVMRITPPAPPTAAMLAAAAGQTTGGAAAAPGAKGRVFSVRGKAPKSRAGRAAAAAAAKAEKNAAAAAAAAQAAAQAAAAAAEAANPEIRMFTYKQRNISKMKLLAPDYKHVVTLNDTGEMCIYEVLSAKMVFRTQFTGHDLMFQVNPVDPLLAVIGALGHNYGLTLLRWDADSAELVPTATACLTHQIVSRVIFSRTGTHLIAAAMSAGHLFIYKMIQGYKLRFVRYAEIGRGLADCFLMKVGEFMRAFALVLFSDKFLMGERIVCINADTGKDNKFAGKMRGPYCCLQSLSTKDTIFAIPHLSRDFHILKLAGDKGPTVSVKMGPIISSGHDLKLYRASRGLSSLVTFGADGSVILRRADGTPEYDYKVQVSHRYETGVRIVTVDADNNCLAHLAHNRTAGISYLHSRPENSTDVRHEPPEPKLFEEHSIDVFDVREKNYLDVQEDKKVAEEAMYFKHQRKEVVLLFHELQEYLVELLEENINEIPLHQLSLSEFNLHMEFKRERLKQAEIEREKIRLETEARIKAQDKVTAWIKEKCWNSMLTPRVKVFAIFSHYQVENYPVLPSQRDQWPELQQTAALRLLEMENDMDIFKPWDEEELIPKAESVTKPLQADIAEEEDGALVSGDVGGSETQRETLAVEEVPEGEPYVLSGTGTHKYITVPPFMIPQTSAFSFLQMNYLYQIVELNVQNVRLWFNKKFDELMAQKRRECGLVGERNARLRFILSELNKLSDLRGSFHHIMIPIKDPEWRQEEEPTKLTKVEVSECTISPYSSQILVIPPELGPKDDFRERALNEMMDGVLEKLWHEEIKKPIPKPQCMLDKDPEHWNEEDLKKVFDYEAKVRFREEEREKYRRMLHAEYAKLTQTLNENIVKFNAKVKDMWLTKLKVDSVIGQENLNLMRLRRVNLDRMEAAEELEEVRNQIVLFDKDVEHLQKEFTQIQEQQTLCQQAYEALVYKDRMLDRTFKNSFLDYSQIILDQCYKFYKKRPKWYQRASMIPAVLNELAVAIGTNSRPPLLHPDCLDYVKGVEQLDQMSNMPAVLDENLWATTCRLRRTKIENEIRMRAMVLDTAYVDQAGLTWTRALQARRTYLQQCYSRVQLHRDRVVDETINRTMQLVLPAGQVEIETTGRIIDFDDAMLLPRADVEEINQLILKVGRIKLRLLRRQIEFRKGILQKEWEHAQMKMKLRHMQQELYCYTRLKIPKELQKFLKDKEQGFTDEDDYKLLEKEMAATKMLIERVLSESASIAEELQVKIAKVEFDYNSLEQTMDKLMVQVSEKRLNEDALEPIRIRRVFKKRMETLVARSALIREVQSQHTRIVILQTELELMRLRTYPTLAPFRTLC